MDHCLGRNCNYSQSFTTHTTAVGNTPPPAPPRTAVKSASPLHPSCMSPCGCPVARLARGRPEFRSGLARVHGPGSSDCTRRGAAERPRPRQGKTTKRKARRRAKTEGQTMAGRAANPSSGSHSVFREEGHAGSFPP